MIQLHALARGPVPVSGLTGASELDLEDVTCGSLHAVVSHPDAVPRRPGRAELLVHARIVEAVCRTVEALPVRYGAFHTRTASLREAILQGEAELLGVLSRVGGGVEVVVRPREDPNPREGSPQDGTRGSPPGRAYLERRRARERAVETARRSARARLHRVAGSLSEGAAETLEIERRGRPERAFLVPRRDAETFLARARAMVAAEGDLLVGGPWPPYSFASSELPP